MSAIVNRFMRVLTQPKQYDEPKDWPRRKKYTVVLVIAYCAFTSPLGLSIYMPAATEMQRDFDTTLTLISATMSVYLLAIGILPMFWASLCDYMGRRTIYIISMTIATFGSLGCALAKSIGVFLAMRVLLGFGSSSVIAVGGGTLSDVFHPGERGTAFGIFYLGPLLSPIVGPLVGGVLAEIAGWRSTMWFLLGCVVIAWLSVVLVLPETHRDRVNGKVVGPPSSANIEELSNKQQTSTAPLSAIEEVTIDRPPSLCTSEAERTATEMVALEHTSAAVDTFTTTGSSTGEGSFASSLKSLHGSTISAPILHKQPATDHIELADQPLSKDHLQEQTEKPDDHAQESTPTPSGSAQSPSPPQKKLRLFNPLRPLVCLKHRINLLAVMFNAFGLGGQISLINTIPVTFHGQYHLSEAKIGLSMMSLGVGLALGSVLGGRYSDFVIRRWLIKQERLRNLDCENPSSVNNESPKEKSKQHWWKKMSQCRSKKNHDTTTEGDHKDRRRTGDGKNMNVSAVKTKVTVATRAPPEIRLRSTWIGAIFLPLGLLIYGWAVEKEAPIAIPLLGCLFTGFGMMMVMTSTTTVLVDANAENNMSAAAVSCSSCMRGIVGATGGILSLPMMGAMGNGWLYTLWAIIAALGFCAIVVVILRAATWRQQKRMKSKKGEERRNG